VRKQQNVQCGLECHFLSLEVGVSEFSSDPFRIRLPITNGTPNVGSGQSSAHDSFQGWKLLLVEDNEDARSMLATMLRLEGSEVADAGDGERALELFGSFQPDVAIIDIGLPVMDGYQLAGRVRKIDEFSGTLLIALTGYGREADRQAALRAGFDDHLVKPLNPAELFRSIAKRDFASRTN
jgi:CheY-like chemotaxis protein